jgi:lysophospholipase L1-like esterase
MHHDGTFKVRTERRPLTLACRRAPAPAFLLAFCLLNGAPSGSPLRGADPPQFEFHDGDRVVFLGGSFMEREGASVPNVGVTFRNLGWSGDTVWAESRSIFDPPQVGYQRLIELLKELKPTVLFLAYGANESFAGEEGLTPFVQQYEKLLDDLAPLKCRLVFFTPHQFERAKPPLPDASVRNPMLGRYAQAIRDVAERHGGWLVDLFDRTEQVTLTRHGDSAAPATGPDPPRGFHQVDGVWKSLPLTENGIHLSTYGYLRASRMMLQALKLPRPEFLLHLDGEGEPESDVHVVVSDFHSDGKKVRFKVCLLRLPEPPTPIFPRDVEYFTVAGGGLPSGHYELKIDGKVAALNPTMLVGFPVQAGADYEQAEQLRKKIVAKNQLFFHRWRPQNITYLTGFRKHEQGNNAVEIARFDPLVEQAEAEIAVLKKPVKKRKEIGRTISVGMPRTHR